ncbi:hypothetical protein KKF84_13170 [Myxococcota bacterium]|nr:hypothetical protein [Myxococcota bacterium]
MGTTLLKHNAVKILSQRTPALLLILLAALLAGCVTPTYQKHKLLKRAVKDLKCAQEHVRMRYLGNGTYEVFGCDKMRAYDMRDCKLDTRKSKCTVIESTTSRGRPTLKMIFTDNTQKTKTQTIVFRQGASTIRTPDLPVLKATGSHDHIGNNLGSATWGLPLMLYGGYSVVSTSNLKEPPLIGNSSFGLYGVHLGASLFLQSRYFVGLNVHYQDHSGDDLKYTDVIKNSYAIGFNELDSSNRQMVSLASLYWELRIGRKSVLSEDLFLLWLVGVGYHTNYYEAKDQQFSLSTSVGDMFLRFGAELYYRPAAFKGPGFLGKAFIGGGVWYKLPIVTKDIHGLNSLFFTFNFGRFF